MKNSKESLLPDSKNEDLKKGSTFEIKQSKQNTEISIYPQKSCSPVFFANQALKIRAAFPDLEPTFLDIMQDIIFEEKICEKRLQDAIKHVIKTHIWHNPPRVAAFLDYDERITFYNHHQLLLLNEEYNGKVFQYYSKVKLSFTDKILYAKNTDIDKYNLQKS